MKKLAVAAGLLASCTWSYAGAGVMIAFCYDFGGSPGVTVKVLSTNKPDRFGVAAGVSFLPWANNNKGKVGFDVDGVRTFQHTAVALGWDIVQNEAHIAAGFASTHRPSAPPAPPAITPSGSYTPLSLDRFLNDAPTSLN